MQRPFTFWFKFNRLWRKIISFLSLWFQVFYFVDWVKHQLDDPKLFQAFLKITVTSAVGVGALTLGLGMASGYISPWTYLSLDWMFLLPSWSNICKRSYTNHCLCLRASTNNLVIVYVWLSHTAFLLSGWALLLFQKINRCHYFCCAIWPD